MKTYETINGTNKSLKIQVYYNLGGINYFTYKNEARGYYLSVSPVEVSQSNGCTIESYTAFSGTKILLLETKRKSDKAYAQAVELSKNELPRLKEYVLKQFKAEEV